MEKMLTKTQLNIYLWVKMLSKTQLNNKLQDFKKNLKYKNITT